MATCYVILEKCYFEDVEDEESIYCVTTKGESYAKRLVKKLNEENNGYDFRYIESVLD